MCRKSPRSDQRTRRLHNEADRRKVAVRIVRRPLVKRLAPNVGTAVAEYELVSIGRRPRPAKRTNRPARTGRILHHHLLTENFAHALSNDARRDVARATGSKWNNQSERPRWIDLSARDMCNGSESAVALATRCKNVR